MAFEGAILIAVVAWWVSDRPLGAQTSSWPPVLICAGLVASFAPFMSIFAGWSEYDAPSVLLYGLSHLFFVALISVLGLAFLHGSAYEYLLMWCAWGFAANAALCVVLGAVIALRRPRV
jgi:hypothetical protein